MLRLVFVMFILGFVHQTHATSPYDFFAPYCIEVMLTVEGPNERRIRLEQDGLVSFNYSLYEEGKDSHILRISWHELDKKKTWILQDFVEKNLEFYDSLANNPNITRTDFFIRRIIVIREANYSNIYVINETENVEEKVNKLIRLVNELLPKEDRELFEFPLS